MQNKNNKSSNLLLFILVLVVAVQGYFIYDIKTKNISDNSTQQASSVELIADEKIPQQNNTKKQTKDDKNLKDDKKEQRNNKIEDKNKEKKNIVTKQPNNQTNTVHYDPFYEIRKMQEQMIKEFNSFNSIFANDPFFKNSFNNMSFAPLSDLKEEKDKYIVTLDIPGIDEKNIKIDTKDNILSISATNQKSSEKKDENYIQKERYMQSFKRVFTLPSNANMSKLDTKYSNGVLTINIPKI
jgi:HSP20 family protein